MVGIDADEAVAEAGVGADEAGEFAPSHAGVGGGDDEDLVLPLAPKMFTRAAERRVMRPAMVLTWGDPVCP